MFQHRAEDAKSDTMPFEARKTSDASGKMNFFHCAIQKIQW